MSMIFALVLFGCADDGTQCERLAAQPASYASMTLCRAGQDEALESDAARRADFPLVVSRCLRNSALSTADRARTQLTVRGD